MTFRLMPIALVLVAGLAFGQQPQKKETPKEPAKPAPGSLEDTLEKALRNSADIKAAEAKIREAEAEANRVRSVVLTKATTLHTNLNVAKRMLVVAEELFAKTKAGVERGINPQGELLVAQSTVEKARGEVELLETELKSLRGEFAVKNLNTISGAAFSPDGRFLYATTLDSAFRAWDIYASSGDAARAQDLAHALSRGPAPAQVQPSMAERVRKLLDQEVEQHFDGRLPAEAMRMLIQVTESDIPLRDMTGKSKPEADFSLTGKLSVAAWIQAIEDTDQNFRVVIRDYGLLMTTKDKIPDGAVRVAEFWKAKEGKPKEAAKSVEKK